MFPANPANGEYVFGSPVFSEVSLKVAGNKHMVVKAKNNSKENIYIQSITLNGKPYSKSFITHAELQKGGVLEMVMGPQPNKQFGADAGCWPSGVE